MLPSRGGVVGGSCVKGNQSLLYRILFPFPRATRAPNLLQQKKAGKCLLRKSDHESCFRRRHFRKVRTGGEWITLQRQQGRDSVYRNDQKRCSNEPATGRRFPLGIARKTK